jgi:hypothetical protein
VRASTGDHQAARVDYDAAPGDDGDAVTAVRRALQLNPSLSRQLDDPVLDRVRERDDFPH